jgi:hypothetical protein
MEGALLIVSNEGSLKTADTVPLAISLWRLWMWEKEGVSHQKVVGRWLSN